MGTANGQPLVNSGIAYSRDFSTENSFHARYALPSREDRQFAHLLCRPTTTRIQRSSPKVLFWRCCAVERAIPRAPGPLAWNYTNAALEEPEALKGTHMIGYGTAAWDNFLTRTLGGPNVFRLPARSLNATHLEQAKQKLSNFEIVMMLDEFDTDSAQLAHVLGWEALVVEEHLPAERLPKAEHTINPFSEKQLRELAEVNKLDIELVCFARALARERTARATRRGLTGAGYELVDKRKP